jgi:hypothetical protein
MYIGLMILGRHKYAQQNHYTWAKCLWGWDGCLKAKKSQITSTDKITVELVKAGGRKIRCEIHKLIISIWNKEELPEWKGRS